MITTEKLIWTLNKFFQYRDRTEDLIICYLSGLKLTSGAKGGCHFEKGVFRVTYTYSESTMNNIMVNVLTN